MTRLRASAAALALVAALGAGCGSGSSTGARPASGASGATGATAAGSAAAAQGGRDAAGGQGRSATRERGGERYPGVYRAAKDLCGGVPPARVARNHGIRSTRPLDIARAVARGYRPELRAKARAGCLAGLR